MNKPLSIAINVLLMILWAVGAFLIWPDGVTDTPLSSLTLGSLLKAGGATLMVVFALANAALVVVQVAR